MSLELIRNGFSHFHPALVHFPVGLITAGAALEAWSAIVGRGPSLSARTMLLYGGLGAIGAVLSGLLLFHPADFAGRTLAVAGVHRLLGLAATALILTTVLASGVRPDRGLTVRRLWIYRLAYFGSASLVGLAGHYGGWVVFGWGRVWTG